MKDYIILSQKTAIEEPDNSMSWNINPSCFSHMKHGDRLRVKMISCGCELNVGEVGAIPPEDDILGGIYPIYCNLNSANVSTDVNYGFLGTVNMSSSIIKTYDEILPATNPRTFDTIETYWLYSDYLESSVDIETDKFSKLNIFITMSGNTILDFNFINVVLEISYFKN